MGGGNSCEGPRGFACLVCFIDNGAESPADFVRVKGCPALQESGPG